MLFFCCLFCLLCKSLTTQHFHSLGTLTATLPSQATSISFGAASRGNVLSSLEHQSRVTVFCHSGSHADRG